MRESVILLYVPLFDDSLYNNQIADLNPLDQLKNLMGLALDNNQIIDINPLADLNDLHLLWLSDNHIADLTPLKQLVNLFPPAEAKGTRAVLDFGAQILYLI